MVKFDITYYCSRDTIIDMIQRLGESKMTPSAHGWEAVGPVSINEAVETALHVHSQRATQEPVIALVDVVLAANRNYNKQVLPRIIRFRTDPLRPRSFKELHRLMMEETFEGFCHRCYFHNSKKKYQVLKNLLAAIDELRLLFPEINDDYSLLHQWAKQVDLLNLQEDVIGNIKNVGIATVQHLRMHFGVNTVKPDQRVKEVLHYKFNTPRLTERKAIMAVEQIASITGKTVYSIDQLFVKYGSGHIKSNPQTRSNKTPKCPKVFAESLPEAR
jgi:hypothetical protein